MKLELITAIITVTFLTACSDRHKIKKEDSNIASAQKNADTSPATEELNEGDEDEEITAVPPTVISGSFLTCHAVTQEQEPETVEITCWLEQEGKVIPEVELLESDFLIESDGNKQSIFGFSRQDDGSVSFKMHTDVDTDIGISLKSINNMPLSDHKKAENFSTLIELAAVELKKGSKAASEGKTGSSSQAQEHADISSPTNISISINSNDVHTTDESVSLSLGATDADEMYITNGPDCSFGGIWEPYASNKTWTLGQANAAATVHVKYRDAAGNESICINDSIVHDDLAPRSSSLSISFVEYTSTRFVTLYIYATDASEIYVTSSFSCESGGKWQPYTETLENWELQDSNSLNTVYIKFRDAAGNETSCISDSINHDSSPPPPPVANYEGYTTESEISPLIYWKSSTDLETGLGHYEVSIGTSPGESNVNPWQNVGDVNSMSFNDLNLSSGITYYANVRAIDLAGNISNYTSGGGFIFNHCKSIGLGSNWILVPGNTEYNTTDFCVMKFEAKDNDGIAESRSTGDPWININQNDAITACESLGPDFHLITNSEWMTIATDITYEDSNWSGGNIGNGFLNRGHSDRAPAKICKGDSDDLNAYVESSCEGESTGEFIQKRTHNLSNGEVIWDIAGNVFEWTSYYNATDKPSPNVWNWEQYTYPVLGTATMPITDLIPQIAIDNAWNSTQSIGQYHSGENADGGSLRRGGDFENFGVSGVFSANIRDSFDKLRSDTGFRCAKDIP